MQKQNLFKDNRRRTEKRPEGIPWANGKCSRCPIGIQVYEKTELDSHCEVIELQTL